MWYSNDKGRLSEGEGLEEEVETSHNSFVDVVIFYVENFIDYFGCFFNDMATVGLNS